MWFTHDKSPLLLAGLLGITSSSLAAEPTFTINTDVNFGRIVNLTNSSCTLNAATATLSGVACMESIGTVGNVTISATANHSYTVTLFPPAGPANQISYLPLLDNGNSSDTFNTSANGKINVLIGGTLSTGGIAPSAEIQTNFVFTIRVDSN